MKYTLTLPEYVKQVGRKVDMHYEVDADSVSEAAKILSKHIFNKTKTQIKELIK